MSLALRAARQGLRYLLFATPAFALYLACGGDNGSQFGNPNGNDDGGGGDGPNIIIGTDGQSDGGFGKDSPPMWCGPDGGGSSVPVPGGSEACPDDKNLPGCSCTEAQSGKTAACWTGLRANRNLGVCKDGTTTCTKVNETAFVWGPCQNETCPGGATITATASSPPGTCGPTNDVGAKGCGCFSTGQWNIANVVPCIYTYNGAHPGDPNSTTYALSTYPPGGDAGTGAQCPNGPTPPVPPPPPTPAQNWSTDTLTADCTGHFKLCYQLRAGSYDSPKPTDCGVLANPVCVEGDYPQKGVVTPFPPISAWLGTNTACAAQFGSTGGYGEMSVQGAPWVCSKASCSACNIDNGSGGSLVFNRIKYCPLKCATCGNPCSDPDCQKCYDGAQGTFH
jgi:hypothetical protein